MNILPESTHLGILKITNVYEYFDIPCLFSCENNSGQIFIAVWIDETENDNEWLYVPVSKVRLKQITSGNIDLRDTFLKSEDNFVLKVTLSKQDENSQVETIVCSEISEEYLPEANQFIESNLQTSSVTRKDSLKQKAIALQREILKITLDFSNIYSSCKNEAPLKELGNILVSLQELFNAIGQLKKGVSTANGSVSQEIKAEARFNIMAVSSGSFVTEIAAAESGNLFNESLANEIIEEFIQVINSSENQEELTKIIKKFKIRAARKYRDFLIKLQTAGTQLKIDWESPIPNKGGSVFLKETTINNALMIINQVQPEPPQIINVTGTLIGGNKRSKRFEIEDDNDRKTYKGAIAQTALNSSVILTLDKRYEFVLEETKKINPSTNEVSCTYKLIRLKLLTKE